MPRRKQPEGLSGLAATGDRRASLEALRDLLARQLREVMAELDALPNPNEKSPVDELTRKRDARRSKAAG